MVLLSCSGTGGGIYAKLANGVARHNCARDSATQVTVFLLYNVAESSNPRGEVGLYGYDTAFGNPANVYTVADFDMTAGWSRGVRIRNPSRPRCGARIYSRSLGSYAQLVSDTQR